MHIELANATSLNPDAFVADVIVNDIFAYRIVSMMNDGVNTLRLKDAETGEIVSETVSDRGKPFGSFDRYWWVKKTLEVENNNH